MDIRIRMAAWPQGMAIGLPKRVSKIKITIACPTSQCSIQGTIVRHQSRKVLHQRRIYWANIIRIIKISTPINSINTSSRTGLSWSSPDLIRESHRLSSTKSTSSRIPLPKNWTCIIKNMTKRAQNPAYMTRVKTLKMYKFLWESDHHSSQKSMTKFSILELAKLVTNQTISGNAHLSTSRIHSTSSLWYPRIFPKISSLTTCSEMRRLRMMSSSRRVCLLCRMCWVGSTAHTLFMVRLVPERPIQWVCLMTLIPIVKVSFRNLSLTFWGAFKIKRVRELSQSGMFT